MALPSVKLTNVILSIYRQLSSRCDKHTFRVKFEVEQNVFSRLTLGENRRWAESQYDGEGCQALRAV
jgi:hypothetical protein